MRYWGLVLGLAFIIIVVGAIATRDQRNTNTPTTDDNVTSTTTTEELAVRGEVPDITLANYDGEPVSLQNRDADVLVINAWATWCPFCTDELPAFASLQEAFPDRVEVIAVNRQESRSTAKNFTDERNISNDLTFLLDSNDQFYNQIGGFSMPETIFVDKNGQIRIHKRGPMELDEMKEKVRQVLRANAASSTSEE